MKSIAEFDAEALRTLSYGFVAAALFGEFPLSARAVYLLCGVGSYIVARSLLRHMR